MDHSKSSFLNACSTSSTRATLLRAKPMSKDQRGHVDPAIILPDRQHHPDDRIPNLHGSERLIVVPEWDWRKDQIRQQIDVDRQGDLPRKSRPEVAPPDMPCAIDLETKSTNTSRPDTCGVLLSSKGEFSIRNSLSRGQPAIPLNQSDSLGSGDDNHRRLVFCRRRFGRA